MGPEYDMTEPTRVAGVYLATANVPEITAGTARLAALIRARPPRGLVWAYRPRPDLTHATICRVEGPPALAEALR